MFSHRVFPWMLVIVTGVIVAGCGPGLYPQVARIDQLRVEYQETRGVASEKDQVAKTARAEADTASGQAKSKGNELAGAIMESAQALDAAAQDLKVKAEAARKEAYELNPALSPGAGASSVPAPAPAPVPASPPAAVPDLNAAPPAPPAAVSQVDWFVKEFSYTGMRRLTLGDLPEGWEFGIVSGQSLDLKVKGTLLARLSNREGFKAGCYSFAVGTMVSRVSEINCPPGGVMSQ